MDKHPRATIGKVHARLSAIGVLAEKAGAFDLRTRSEGATGFETVMKNRFGDAG
ncbi:hypothetical protein [Noviherbaspirillum sp.]|uniref:hypothetical protein n=1 Tax=Noviherbaspirillum sp. TaxID=1926288 RepID=UPI002B473F1D|nr:hypothetical protein [Noviherbaspirillum sp.]HJV83220.1 hypothetical protein [Noviherbaspirillum sp.]